MNTVKQIWNHLQGNVYQLMPLTQTISKRLNRDIIIVIFLHTYCYCCCLKNCAKIVLVMIIYDVEKELCVFNTFQGLSRDKYLGCKIPWTGRIGSYFNHSSLHFHYSQAKPKTKQYKLFNADSYRQRTCIQGIRCNCTSLCSISV